MKSQAEEVLVLQNEWDSKNTPAMQRRGVLIRDEIPDFLSANIDKIKKALRIAGEDIGFEGSDGTGLKTQIPWVRCHSQSHSPNPREGWYCVYLFRADGSGLYLALAHGSTRWENGEYRARPPSELAAYVTWAKNVLDSELARAPELSDSIALGGRGNLGPAYESSTVASIFYSRESVPKSKKLLLDLERFCRLLAKLYEAESLGRAPYAVSIDTVAAEELVSAIAAPSKPTRRGQGFGLKSHERIAVDRRAMAVASSHLVGMGYEVEDVSRTHPFDFVATKAGVSIIVEVKGTTGPPGSIILTRNEVDAHKQRHPLNALLIVHSIDLDRASKVPYASGGIALMESPWDINLGDLRPLSYQYIF